MPEEGLTPAPQQVPPRAESGVTAVGSAQMVTSMQMTFQGPLPPAIELHAYEQIVAGAAERIIAMAEKQSAHRMELEKLAVREQLRQSARGQIFALIIGITGILSAAGVALLGFSSVAIAIVAASLGTLAVSFITGRRQEQQSRQQKAG